MANKENFQTNIIRIRTTERLNINKIKKKLVFGLGTGRCGTKSLSKLLNKQSHAYVTHERKPILPWKEDISLPDSFLNQFKSADYFLVGDVAFYYLPYVQDIFAKNSDDMDLYFICLKRNKADTLKSYAKWTVGRNHWNKHDGITYRYCTWDKAYPKYNTTSKDLALEEYYDEYYATAEALEAKYSEQFKIFSIDDLNTRIGVHSILKFINLDPSNFKIKTNIHMNTSKSKR